MLFHDHRCIFFHVPRTAGQSVEVWLDNSERDPYTENFEIMFGLSGSTYLQHATAEFLRSCVKEEIFNSYFKFSIVRNPFERIWSVFNYQRESHVKKHGDFKGFVSALPTIVNDPNGARGSHYLPQFRYTHVNDQRCCDEIIYFEMLPAAISYIATRLKTSSVLPHLNASRIGQGAKMRDVYDEEMIKIMRRIYARDFEYFGYSDSPR